MGDVWGRVRDYFMLRQAHRDDNEVMNTNLMREE
jgi:hypothetical protein